jgi:hypothetical protein
MHAFIACCADAQRRWRRVDRLVRLMIVNWLGGMAVGVICAALALAFDVAGLRTLLWSSDVALLGAAMLIAAFAFSFGGIVCAAAVMRAGDDDEPPRGGRKSRLGARLKVVFPPALARDP